MKLSTVKIDLLMLVSFIVGGVLAGQLANKTMLLYVSGQGEYAINNHGGNLITAFYSKTPGALIECKYIENYVDYNKIYSSSNLKQQGKSITGCFSTYEE